MSAIFKGFDVAETGRISLEGFQCIGEALNWGQWSERQNRELHASMDLDQDGVLSIDEWLHFYTPVITVISDEQFEDGLCDFEDAVIHCCQKEGITSLPPRFAHDDNYIYHTGSFFGTEPMDCKAFSRWSSKAGHDELRASVVKSAESRRPSGIARVNMNKIDEATLDLAFDEESGDEI